MNKLERLLKLLAVLLDTSVPLTAEDLRQRIGGYPDNDQSFRRAFERDKDELRGLGVTISVDPVPTVDPPIDGYSVDQKEYAGQDPGLEADELAALHLAAALVRVEELGDDALRKLGGRGDVDTAAIDTDVLNADVGFGAADQTNGAGTIQEAITKRQVLRFGYGDLDREIEPALLSFKGGRWYVSGFDRTRNAERVFRLDRIAGAIEVGAPKGFEPRKVRGPQVTRTWELGDGDAVSVEVQVEAAMANQARLQLEPSEITEQADGSIVATVEVRNQEALRDWVLGFYDNAVVLAPAEMRTMMIEWSQGMASA